MKVVEIRDFGPKGFKWLTLKRITYEDAHGRFAQCQGTVKSKDDVLGTRFWEVAERTTRAGEVDGVAVIAKVLRARQEPHVVVISQYRPPLANHCLELPAGLVDQGESAAEAAMRELKEETGYTGHAVEVWPPCGGDPGMSSSNMQIVMVEVDGDAPHNQDAVQQLEDGEFITVTLVPMRGLMQYLLDARREKGWEIDSRLMAYAAGLQHGSELPHTAPAAAAATAAEETCSVASGLAANGHIHAASLPGAAPASAGLEGFGSLVPDDLELGHAVESAVAALVHRGSTADAGGACCPVPDLQGTGSTLTAPKQAAAATAAATGAWCQAEGPDTLAAGAMQQGWAVAKQYLCTPQFALGLGMGAAAATLLVKLR